MINILKFIQGLINNNIGVVTFLVGFIAIYLYIKQRVDRKRDAARLILQEIRYAEQKIRKYREVKSYRLYDRLLPTNSWNDNIHLFIKELKEIQNVDLISDFYAKASYIDTLIAIISRQKNNPPAISSNISPNPLPFLQNSITPTVPVFQQVGDFQTPMGSAQSVEISFIPPISQKILEDVSMNVEFIYNTPVVERLRKISEKKWYQIF